MWRPRKGEPQGSATTPPPAAPRDAVLVTGLPGSGKSTLVNSRHFPREIAAPITFSDLMDDVLRDEHDGKSLSQLWPVEREAVQKSAAERLAAYRPDRLLVIDGHLIVPTARGWERGVPPEVWSTVSMIAIVVIHVYPNEMERRRGHQITQGGLHERIEEITIRQNIVQSTATYYAASLNRRPNASSGTAGGQACALRWIVNAEGRQEMAERELAEYIRLVRPPR